MYKKSLNCTRFVDMEDFLGITSISVSDSVFITISCVIPIWSLIDDGCMGSFLMIYAGNPWTEEEHMLFLLGLQKLGKGDWRGISRNYVVSRSPTQVASHAQKYFIRKGNTTGRKRRSSLFDMETDEVPLSLCVCVCHCNEQMFASVHFSFLRGKCL